jgi:hypothetical protein
MRDDRGGGRQVKRLVGELPGRSLLAECLRVVFAETQAAGSTHLPSTVRTDNALKVRFSATLGEEDEVEVALV